MERQNGTQDFTEITPDNCCELFDAPVITDLTFNNDLHIEVFGLRSTCIASAA